MNLQKIELLIEKYEKGETSLNEEMELKIFFAKENVPFHLSGYKNLFTFYRKAGEEEITDPDFDEKVLRVIAGPGEATGHRRGFRRLYPVLSIAAGLLLILGLYFVFMQQKKITDTFNDPELAYAETKKILLKVAGNLNTGVDELSNVKEINTGLDDLSNIKSFNEGLKQMNKISILDKSKDSITQKTNK